MIGDWRAAAVLERTTFPELAYEIIYAVRQGNLPPTIPPAELRRRSVRRVLQSKLLVAGLIAFLSVGSGTALTPVAHAVLAPGLPLPLYRATVLSGLLALELVLVWWTGLQVLPTLFTSPIPTTLSALPISKTVRDRAMLLLFLRLFDLPVGSALVATPIVVALALGNPLAGLAVVPGVLVGAIFALGLSLATGRFLVRHVIAAPGGAGRTVLRWAYLVLWALPAFATYAYVTFGSRVLSALAGLAAGPSPALLALLAIYPFPFSALPASVGAGGDLVPGARIAGGIVLALSAAGYSLVALGAARWLVQAPGALASDRPTGPVRPGAGTGLVPRSPPVSVLVKDLRIASRSPGYAFLILLPILNAVAIGLWTLTIAPGPGATERIASAAVATAALVTTFFSPAFFAVELTGFAYTRTLPLSERALLAGKVLLVGILYLAAAGIVLLITLTRLFEPVPFATFVAAEFPAVLAAALVELGLLARIAHRRALPIPNLYAGSWWTAIVTIPGIVLAGAPLVLYAVGSSVDGGGGVLAMALLALAELGMAATFSLLAVRRGRG